VTQLRTKRRGGGHRHAQAPERCTGRPGGESRALTQCSAEWPAYPKCV
jgi:hypothetical protein